LTTTTTTPSTNRRALANDDAALAACWHPVARGADVGTTPVRVRLLGHEWSIVRRPGPDDGSHLAGWRDRYGSSGTAPAALRERHGIVFLAPEPPRNELLDIPEADDPTFAHGELEVIEARAGAGLLLDNFLDMSHFPFVHAATIGTDEAAIVDELEIERHGFAMTVRGRHPFPNHEDPGVAAGLRPLLQTRALTYEYRAPFSATLRIEYVEAGGTNVIDFQVQPVDADTCRIYTSIHRNDLGGDPRRLAEALVFERRILDEDLVVQEAYVDRRLPLDLTTEVHVRADRVTVELRRILADLVRPAADDAVTVPV
jgi:vanillate O-demethylase monooxygenase subunit